MYITQSGNKTCRLRQQRTHVWLRRSWRPRAWSPVAKNATANVITWRLVINENIDNVHSGTKNIQQQELKISCSCVVNELCLCDGNVMHNIILQFLAGVSLQSSQYNQEWLSRSVRLDVHVSVQLVRRCVVFCCMNVSSWTSLINPTSRLTINHHPWSHAVQVCFLPVRSHTRPCWSVRPPLAGRGGASCEAAVGFTAMHNANVTCRFTKFHSHIFPTNTVSTTPPTCTVSIHKIKIDRKHCVAL